MFPSKNMFEDQFKRIDEKIGNISEVKLALTEMAKISKFVEV